MSLPLNEAGSGYSSRAYPEALGLEALALGQTGGFVHRRPIAGTGQHDLAGVWPLFCCPDWQALAEVVGGLAPGPVSLTLVADPFAALGPAELAAIFPICRPLHAHWVIDLAATLRPSAHHLRKLRAAPPQIRIGPPWPGLADDWARLYAHLVDRKQIADARAFAPAALAAQLAVPGAEIVTAWEGDRLLGADLYYLDRGIAYAHLSAYAPEGYAASVSYPMMAAAIDHFRPRAGVIDLGGAPGGTSGPGVAAFKAGWTGLTRPSHLCGKVLDAGAYTRLAPGASPAGWFPAYRAGEYGA